jgi:hypothetical protein
MKSKSTQPPSETATETNTPSLPPERSFFLQGALKDSIGGRKHLPEEVKLTPDQQNKATLAASVPLSNPLSQQVGGTHYKKMVIQPIEFISANKLGFCEGSAIKYICRWKDKGGVVDLEKAIHYLEMLIDEQRTSSS